MKDVWHALNYYIHVLVILGTWWNTRLAISCYSCRVTKIHMIYPFIGRRIFEVAILQAHKIVHPYLLSSFLVSSSLSRLEDLCEVLGKWQAKACILFRGEGKKKTRKKMLPRREYARKNFKTCDKNLILFLQKGTIYFVP